MPAQTRRPATDEDTIIVGAGPIGLACAISARRRGIDPLVIDAGAIVNSIVHYPIQMGFFTTPELLEIGGHPLGCSGQKPTREEALMYYRGVVRAEGLRVSPYTRLVGGGVARGRSSGASGGTGSSPGRMGAPLEGRPIACDLSGLGGERRVHCARLVLATGYYDNPVMLGIPGEDLSHVRHYFDEAHRSIGLDVVVIGGKNSAAEAALLLFRAGARVTIVYRRDVFPENLKYWVRPDLENRIKAGDIAARLGASVKRIEAHAVVIRRSDGTEETLAADRVFALTGYRPDTALLARLGVTIDPDTGRPAHDPASLETDVPGIYVAGSLTAGNKTSDIFIENGRFDGEKIFGRVAGGA
jgi:thioredoxin reductase (NADPH)